MSKHQSKLTSLWHQDEGDSDDSDIILLDHVPPPCSVGKTKMTKADTSIVQAVSCKKASQWVSSSFDGFGDFAGIAGQPGPSRPGKSRQGSERPTIVPAKRRLPSSFTGSSLSQDKGTSKRQVSRRANKGPDLDLWADKFLPRNQGELAVHKKKITEVESWLREHMSVSKKVPHILLLTGPAGAGKTATVQVLAKELGCHLHEWTNPDTSGYDVDYSSEDFRYRSRLDRPASGSQLSQFQDFLLRANKYNTLDIFGGGGSGRKIILVEEFPNVFYRDQAPFHNLLRKYLQVGGCPLVFIVSDSSKGESNERLLFPKDLQHQLGIENISFNPVAMTSLTKILLRVATEEATKGSHSFTVPSKNVIETIAMASAGDIRGAINALQFACLRDTEDLSVGDFCKTKSSLTKRSSTTNKKSGRVKKSSSVSGSQPASSHSEEELASIGGRDTSLFLFRALGKILYCKRNEPQSEVAPCTLPPHLSHQYRDPLQFRPEDVIEKSHLSGDFFNAYLHQNYPEFYSSIEDIVNASEYLSDADYLTIDWASRSVLQHYAASVASRGLLHCNTARARYSTGGSGLGWKPLHKPQWYSTMKQARENCESARCLFRSYRSPPEVLQTEIIPYISLVNSTLHDTGQIAFIHEMCRFTSHRGIGGGSEKLDEKDIAMDDEEDVSGPVNTSNQSTAGKPLPVETDDVISNSQSNVGSQDVDEEELVIEDYDDD